ncbi:hypothetical protein [Tsukamurella sp. 1534]|uniref:hypothetical protein n=1 Tax=Tsukamurella sp. 1534 TaxID=1151061 RepID=UPI0006ACE614|nr:hypothetical protein [Tsukamurella sp. 1534]
MVGRTWAATLVVLAGLTVGACGQDESKAPPSSPGAASAAQATEAPSTTPDRAPSAAQLEAMLARAVDPGVPAGDKIVLVQGATEADAPLFDELVRVRADNPNVTWRLGKPVLEQPGLAKAPVSALLGETNQTAYATVVFDGTWKLQREYACDILRQVGRDAAACH